MADPAERPSLWPVIFGVGHMVLAGYIVYHLALVRGSPGWPPPDSVLEEWQLGLIAGFSIAAGPGLVLGLRPARWLAIACGLATLAMAVPGHLALSFYETAPTLEGVDNWVLSMLATAYWFATVLVVWLLWKEPWFYRDQE